MELHGWMKAVKAIKCLAEHVVLPLYFAPSLQELLSVLLHQMKEDTLENH